MTANTTANAAQKVLEELQRREVDNLNTFINELTDNMIETERKYRTKMPVDVFRHTYMQFFAGEAVPYTVSEERWLALAGGVNRYVDIVDSEGNVLISIPPRLNYRALYDQSGPDGINFDKVVHESIIQSRKLATLGDRYLQQVALTLRAGNDVPTEEELRIEAEWRKVFEFFGYKHPSEAAAETKAATDDTGTDGADEWAID